MAKTTFFLLAHLPFSKEYTMVEKRDMRQQNAEAESVGLTLVTCSESTFYVKERE